MLIRAFMLTAALLCAGCSADPAPPAITVTDAWARATAPGQSSGAVYATIANAGGPDRLVGVSSDAGMAMIHGNDVKDGVSRMRMLSEVPIPANGSVELAPGGTHIMLSGLTAPLAAGGNLKLRLRFARAGEQPVTVAIVAAGAR